MNIKKIFFIVIIFIFISLATWFFLWRGNPLCSDCGEIIKITNFEDCLLAGNPAMESYPRQCRANGRTFVEEIGNEGR